MSARILAPFLPVWFWIQCSPIPFLHVLTAEFELLLVSLQAYRAETKAVKQKGSSSPAPCRTPEPLCWLATRWREPSLEETYHSWAPEWSQSSLCGGSWSPASLQKYWGIIILNRTLKCSTYSTKIRCPTYSKYSLFFNQPFLLVYFILYRASKVILQGKMHTYCIRNTSTCAQKKKNKGGRIFVCVFGKLFTCSYTTIFCLCIDFLYVVFFFAKVILGKYMTNNKDDLKIYLKIN